MAGNGTERSQRDPKTGHFLPGWKGGPGRPKGQARTLEAHFQQQFGETNTRILASKLARYVQTAPLSEIVQNDWLLKRIWPVPLKIDATVEHRDQEAPEVPAEDERLRSVSSFLDDALAERGVSLDPGTDTIQ